MEVPRKDDILLLADEKFDFDLSLSSSSANEDDEVFLGPVGHKERCIAASLELNHQIPEEPPLPASESHFTWSPLTGEKFVEVYKEAHLLALQIQSNSKTKAALAATPEDPGSQGVEGFIQESKLKINLFERENEVKKSPKSLKRETYHLSDSPLSGPPLWGTQRPSGAALPAAPAQASRPPIPGPPHASCSSLPVEPSAAHPPDQAGTQKKVTSKLLLPRASSLRGKSIPSALEKPMKEKPASPSRMKILNEKDSHSSVPPDKPRAARDVTSLPAGGNHVVQGKRSLPVPNKSGLKKTMLKPPGCAGSLARKSSSGSISGVSASVCASPAAGRAKPRERPSIPADGSQSNTSQSGRTGLVLPRPCLQPGPAGVSCRQSQRPGVAESTAEQPRAPTRAALTQPQSPGQGGRGLNSHLSLSQSSQVNKTGSTRRPGSCLNSKTKLMPAPTGQFKIPECSTGEPLDSATPKSCRAQRPQSCTSVGRVAHSTPARWSSASQSLASSVRTPVSTGRRSALPTPASRRLSSLPLATPKTMPRALASPLRVSARRLSSEPQKKSAVRTAPVREGDSRATAGPSDWSPDGSFPPASAVPQALNFSPEKSDFIFSKSITTEVALDEAQPPEATTPSEVREADIVGLCCPGLPPGDRGMLSVALAPLVPAAPKGRGQDLPPLEETKAASPPFPTMEMARFQRVGDGKQGGREWVSGSSSAGPRREGADGLEGRGEEEPSARPPQPLSRPGPSPALLPWVSKLSVTWDRSRAHSFSQDG
ncbi:G2 and S phase-expressed protein 1 isoform X1 [Mesoplodon densirostris]|uniref:G2 and S phase-expressed protein 1 isoform X1 n=1 Tax=Mesoplodon densirostris TaxID=48708 RepID=UPI0028DB2EE4|nr:G2 and S phase-expressed protein 1 isoform X1 [Mesoplodon densirostris]